MPQQINLCLNKHHNGLNKKKHKVEHLQYAYINPKSKCHSSDGGLSCGKEHAHDREIMSDCSNPHRNFFDLLLDFIFDVALELPAEAALVGPREALIKLLTKLLIISDNILIDFTSPLAGLAMVIIFFLHSRELNSGKALVPKMNSTEVIKEFINPFHC